MTDQQTISVIGDPPFSPCRSTTKSKAMERPCNPPVARQQPVDRRSTRDYNIDQAFRPQARHDSLVSRPRSVLARNPLS